MMDGPIYAWLTAAIVGTAVCGLVVMSGLLDIPDRRRKKHVYAVPTSGGLAIGCGFAAGLAAATLPFAKDWTAVMSAAQATQTAFVVLAAFGALALGFLDDMRPLSAVSKFGAMALGSLIFTIFVARAESFPLLMGVGVNIGPMLGAVGSALWIFTMMNAVNFMDGSNGLAMGSCAIAMIGLAVIAMIAQTPQAAVIALAASGAMAGFLAWNFPRARLFAGDSGSLFAGGIAAFASLVVVQEGGISPLAPPILFFPILADVLLTLYWRVSRKRANLLDGHNEHLYQIGLRAGLSPVQIVMIYWGLTLHCALIAILAALGPRISVVGVSTESTTGLMAVIGAWVVALSPLLALAILAAVALKVHSSVRRFAVHKNLDAPV